MAEIKEEVAGSLKECAVALAMFNLHPDVNVKLTHLQHLNKAYSSLQHKVAAKQIQVADVDAALELAKISIAESIEKVELKPDVKERVTKVAPNNLTQVVDNLKKNNAIEINAKIVFKQEQKPNVD